MPLSSEHSDFSDFVAFLRLKNLSPNTIAGYQFALQIFFKSLPSELSDFGQVTPQQLRAFVAGLQEKGQSPKTVADRVTILKRFFGYLHAESRIPSNPTERLPMPKVGKRLPKALTLEETETLFASLTDDSETGRRNRLLTELMYVTGMRVSEAVGLRRDHVNLAQARVWIERLKSSLSVEQPIAGDELRAIKRYVGTRTDKLPWLFLSERGQPMTRQSVNYLIRMAGESAGLRYVHPHMLRHSCGYYLANSGVDLRTMQDYLGHRDPKHTVHYTRVAGRRFEGLWRQ